MKNAISKAIEGGWKGNLKEPVMRSIVAWYKKGVEEGWTMNPNNEYRPVANQAMFAKQMEDTENSVAEQIDRLIYQENPFFDSLFWQALGKALGKTDAPTGHYRDSDWWKQTWHRFVDHLAEGKDVDSFFNDLIK